MTLRIGIVGASWGANVLAPAIAATPEVEIVGFCAAHQARAEGAAKRFGARWAFDDYRKLVAIDGLDVVCVCTVPAVHEEIVEAAIGAGRHVFCTKPLARTAAIGRTLLERAEARGLKHALDLGRRFSPMQRHMRQLVRTGYLGDLRMISITGFFDWSHDPASHNYHANWLSRRPDGGIMHASFVNHHIDSLRFTFGEIDTVGGLATTLIPEKPAEGSHEDPPVMERVDAEDAVVVHGRFVDGGVFGLTASWAVHHPAGQRWEVYGSKGSLFLDMVHGGEDRLFGARAGEGPPQELSVPELAPAEVPDGTPAYVSRLIPLYSPLIGEFRDQILGRPGPAPNYATFADGLRLLEIGEALQRV